MDCAPHFQKLYQIETKRLILAVGILIPLIVVLLSSSLPYGGVLQSVLSFKSVMVGQRNVVLNSNSTSLSVVNDTEVVLKQESEIRVEEKDPDIDYQLEEDQTSDFESDKTVNETWSVENVEFEDDSKSDNSISSLTPRNITNPVLVSSPMDVETHSIVSSESDEDLSKSNASTKSQNSSVGESVTDTFLGIQSSVQSHVDLVKSTENSSMISDNLTKAKRLVPVRSRSISISEMNNLLHQNRLHSRAMKPRWSSVRDQELLFVKSQIENAPIVNRDRELYAPLYRNISMFKRSYELMDNTLKIYIYNEGDKPIFHQPKLKGIYASEGWFMKLLERNKQFVVKNPLNAHMFYLPFSSLVLRKTLNQNHGVLAEYLKKYVEMLAGKYRFWNRTGGADHFLVACHDWALEETFKYMGTCIRALCNTNAAKRFTIGKDVSLPVTYVRFADDPLRSLGGKPPSQRPFLAFFAGSMHGHVRPLLLRYWENKDPDMKIFGKLPPSEKPNYVQYMKSSKYCICARGYEVHTPRVVEAIFHECVPVIISDNYVPPFFEVLKWETFSVFILEKDIPNIKNILLSIPKKKYLELQSRVKK
ncbi:Xylogalacturonan beta-1,3-xylosyltransferase, partial [Thalictrum thalictroides]